MSQHTAAEAVEPIETSEDLRLIEAGFPCHQVGAETQRERGASSALPPLYFLHVWWARRPLTPSRAAVIASLDPAGTDTETFVRQLGIERVQAPVNGEPWTLTDKLLERLEWRGGTEVLPVDQVVLRAFEKEQERRTDNRSLIGMLKSKAELAGDPVLQRWESESRPLPWPEKGESLIVQRVMGDPAHVQDRIEFAKSHAVKSVLRHEHKWDPEDLYAYGRAFATPVAYRQTGFTVLDPTAGGGSIPFEALRVGHKVIANELNPVATSILHATLDYPAKFGPGLAEDISAWGHKLLAHVESGMAGLAPFSPIPEDEMVKLRHHLNRAPELIPQYLQEYDHTGHLYQAGEKLRRCCLAGAPDFWTG